MPRGWAKRRATSNGSDSPFFLFFVRGQDGISVLRRGLKGPEEESRQPGVLFEGPSGTVSGFRFRRTEYLLERRPTNDFPHIRQEAPLMWLPRFGIAAQGDFSFLGVHNL